MADTFVKVRLFEWFEEAPNPNDTSITMLHARVQYFGEPIDLGELREYDRKRGEELGAFGTMEEIEAVRNGTFVTGTGLDETGTEGDVGVSPDGTTTASVTDWGSFDYENASVEQLAAWVSEEKPVVDRMLEVAAASDSPNMAEKLLAAENQASGNDPRKGVVEGLEKIAADKATQ